MQDVYVYCPDTAALVVAVRDHWPERLNEDDPENPVFALDKTPTVRVGLKTLALVRCRDGEPGEPDVLAGLLELDALGVVRVLGSWDDIQADPARKAVFDLVWPRTPFTMTDDDGAEVTITPPEQPGAFA